MSTRFYSLSLSLQWSRKVVPNRSFWRLSPSSLRALFSMTMDDEFGRISEASTVWMNGQLFPVARSFAVSVLFSSFPCVACLRGWEGQVRSSNFVFRNFHVRMTMLLRKHGGWRFWACPSFFVWYRKNRTPRVIHEPSLQFAGSQPVEVSRICVSWWLLFTRSPWHHELPCLVGVTLVVCSKPWSNCRSCLEKKMKHVGKTKSLQLALSPCAEIRTTCFEMGERDNCLITTSIDLFYSCFIRILHQSHPTQLVQSHTINEPFAENHGWIVTFPLLTWRFVPHNKIPLSFPRNCRNWKTFLPVAWPNLIGCWVVGVGR